MATHILTMEEMAFREEDSFPPPPIQPYISSTPASPAAVASDSPHPSAPSFSPAPTPTPTPFSQPPLAVPSPRGQKRKLSPTPSNLSARGSPAANGTASTPTKDEEVGVDRGPDSENAVARMGVKVPGTVDRVGFGEECWSWSDLPMNKQGGKLFFFFGCCLAVHSQPTHLL
jgi:hypothetical protein